MSAESFMTTLVCDDIRREIGNKLSYMGVYQSQLFVPKLPFVLPKLCFVMNVVIHASTPLNKITFRVLRDEDELMRAEIPIQPEQIQKQAPNLTEDEMAQSATGIFELAQFTIDKPCFLLFRAVANEVELKGGSLRIDLGGPA